MAEQRRSIVPTDHVDDGTMAAYVDGRLSGAAKAAVTAHVADCEDCHFVFVESARARLEAKDGGAGWRPRLLAFRPRWVAPAAVAAGLAAAASVTLVVQPQMVARLFGRSDVAELVAAVGTERHFEPRLTGGFEYGAVTPVPVTRGESTEDRLPPEMRMAALKIEQRLKENRNASTLRAYAAAQLVMGHADKAVPPLEEAARMSPQDARVQSDLAAAYMVRSKDRNSFEDVTRSVGAAKAAVDRDPKLREARFNLALALEGLSLREEARKAWQAYLEIDDTSPWATEARRRLENLSPDRRTNRQDEERRRVVDAAAQGDASTFVTVARRLPDVAYSYVENELLPEWADAWLARDRDKAETALRRARAFSDAIQSTVTDRLIADAIRAIDNVARSDVRELDKLAKAHRVFRDARRLYASDKVTEASVQFKEANPTFERAGSPFSEWATLYISIAEYYHGRLADSKRLLDALLPVAERQDHRLVLGRGLRMRGLVRQVSGDVGNSLDDYRRALATFDAIGAREDVAAIHSSIADNLQAIGDSQQAGAHLVEALGRLDATAFRRRAAIFHRAGQLALQWGDYSAALAVHEEVLAEAKENGQVGDESGAYRDHAEVLIQMGLPRRALADVDAAAPLIQKLPDAGIAARHRAEWSLVRGEVTSDIDPRSATDSLNTSLAYFRDHSMEERLARVYLALGRLQRATGRTFDAEETFRAGIAVLERQRLLLPNGAPRLSYFEQPWNLYDELLDLVSSQSDQPGKALAIAERGRARDLLDTAGPNDPLIDPTALQQLLPAGVVVAYFAALPNRVVVWTIDRDRISSSEEHLTAATAAAKVTALVSELQKGLPAADTLAMQLFDDLMAPWIEYVPAGTTLIIIPDGPLHSVPFAALLNRRTGRRLVEDYAIETAPSASMYVHARTLVPRGPFAKNTSVFVIGNPTIDREEASGLPSLEAAERETADIRSQYPGALVLTGARATKTAFLEAAGYHTIVHFGGHAIANDTYPILSRLLLARGDNGTSGSVFANELLGVDFTATKLVVLAACRTAVGPIRKGEGPIGLARPFLARGVPTIVATLWDVDDEASRVFFQTFYEALAKGEAPTNAVRNAQIRMLKLSDAALRLPRAWSGFVAIGG